MATFFYFGNDYSAENRTSSHHIATYLHKMGHRIVYVESPGLRKPSVSGRDVKKIFSKVLKTLKGPQRVYDNFYVYTLFQLPFHKFSIVKSINKLLLRVQPYLLRKQFKGSKVYYFFTLPHLSSYIRFLSRKGGRTVYYCVDNYSVYPGVNKDSIREMDIESTRYSSFVFVVSETLLEEKKLVNHNTYLSTHGVDYEHFAVDNDLSDVEDEVHLKRVFGPIIGYWGLIEDWFDVDLISFVAERLPEYNIVLIGYVAIDCSVLQKYKNVHFLGKKPYTDLPQYGKYFDVSIMPYRLTQQVLNSNPMKLREYLSLGKPVVSVGFPEVERFADVVCVSGTYEEFVGNIVDSIKEDNDSRREKRRKRVTQETWSYKVQKLMAIIKY